MAKLVGCCRVTRGSSPGARSCRNFNLQIDFPLKGSEAFPVLLRVVAELGIPNFLLENDQAENSGRGGALSPWSLCIVLVLARGCTEFPTPSSPALENVPPRYPAVPHLPALKGKEN